MFVLMNSQPSFLRLLTATIVLVLCLAANAANSSAWAGEYRDDKFLGGRAVFQLTIDQTTGALHVTFDAAWNDAHGAAPGADGPATVSGSTLTFKFKDSFGNSGTGTITRAGSDVLVSINPTHVVESRCLGFYGKDMRVKRVVKK